LNPESFRGETGYRKLRVTLLGHKKTQEYKNNIRFYCCAIHAFWRIVLWKLN